MSCRWDDIAIGDAIGTITFPITVSRLVIAAGANRDFNAIHHNKAFARTTGAPDIYANSLFLQGMWERAVRAYIGPSGRIWSLGGFRMRSFNCPGDTVVVSGTITEKWMDGDKAMIRIELRSDNKAGLTVGPGFVTAEVPCD